MYPLYLSGKYPYLHLYRFSQTLVHKVHVHVYIVSHSHDCVPVSVNFHPPRLFMECLQVLPYIVENFGQRQFSNLCVDVSCLSFDIFTCDGFQIKFLHIGLNYEKVKFQPPEIFLLYGSFILILCTYAVWMF